MPYAFWAPHNITYRVIPLDDISLNFVMRIHRDGTDHDFQFEWWEEAHILAELHQLADNNDIDGLDNFMMEHAL